MEPEQLNEQIAAAIELATRDGDDVLLILDAVNQVIAQIPARDTRYIPILQELRATVLGDMRYVWPTALLAARIAPEALANTMHACGLELHNKRRYKQSIPPLQIAVITYLWSNETDGAGRAGMTIADALYSCGTYQAAERAARQARKLFEEDGNWYGVAKCLLVLANIYADQYRTEQSLDMYQQALAIFNGRADRNIRTLFAIADAHVGVGSVLEEQSGNYTLAQEYFSQAEQIGAELSTRFPDQTLQDRTAFTLRLNRAILALESSRHAEARRLFNQAEAVLDAEDPDEHLDEDPTDRCELLLYQAYQMICLGNYPEANHYLTSIRNLLRRLDKQSRKKRWADAILFEATLPDLPDKTALDHLDKVAQIYQELSIDRTVQITIERARIWYRSGEVATARTYMAQAEASLDAGDIVHQQTLDILEATYDPDVTIDRLKHILDTLQNSVDYIGRATVASVLGRRLEQAGEKADARDAYLVAVAAIGMQRGLLRLSVNNIPFLLLWRLPYERAFALAPKEDHIARWQLSEEARAQVMLDELVNDRDQHLLLDSQHPRLQKLRALRDELDQYLSRSAAASPRSLRSGVQTVDAHLVSELARLQLLFDAELDALLADGVDEAAWISGKPIDSDEIGRMLGDSTALISYFLVRSMDGGHDELWAIVLAPGAEPDSIPLKRFQRFRRVWEQNQSGFIGGGDDELANTLLRELGQALIEPLLPKFGAARNLVFIPDERLPLLPLHAARLANGDYLIQHYAISYAPSAAVLWNLSRREAGRQAVDGVVLCGWPDTGEAFLEHVQTELRAIGALLNVTPEYRSLSQAWLYEQTQGARLVHIACHGKFPDKAGQFIHPRFAFLKLGEDLLYAYDLSSFHLQADLLTLSACESGRHGDGLQGLVSAGLVAGASSVLATMWAAEDKNTALLMRVFYQHLVQNHASRAEALRQAQTVLIERGIGPTIWAPFFLTGLATPLPTVPGV